MTYYPFINVQFPVNVSIYLKALFNLANMEVLPTEDLKEYFGTEFDRIIEYDE